MCPRGKDTCATGAEAGGGRRRGSGFCSEELGGIGGSEQRLGFCVSGTPLAPGIPGWRECAQKQGGQGFWTDAGR